MKNTLEKSYLSILAAWLFLTVFVDFFVIPTAFRQLGDIFIAGELGIRVFSALNIFEIIFAGALVVYSFYIFKGEKTKRDLLKIFLNFILIVISCFYFFYLTGKIAELTDLWKSSAVITEEALKVVKNEHNFYHTFYVRTDVVKLVVLLIGLILAFKEKGEAQ